VGDRKSEERDCMFMCVCVCVCVCERVRKSLVNSAMHSINTGNHTDADICRLLEKGF